MRMRKKKHGAERIAACAELLIPCPPEKDIREYFGCRPSNQRGASCSFPSSLKEGLPSSTEEAGLVTKLLGGFATGRWTSWPLTYDKGALDPSWAVLHL